MAKPAVHFKKFNEDWEKNKAAELFISITDKEHSELPVLSATQDFGMIKRDETGINIFHDIKNEEGYKRVLPGQFVIHLRSFQGGFAHSSIEGITSPAYTVFGFKEQNKHDDIFWKYIFSSEIFINRLRKVTYGIRDGRSISYDEFLTLKFSFPSKMEQTKIGAFFSTLDKLITLSQRKYDKLVNVKKVMLTKMFPRDGAKVPEIRFKGFAGDWKKIIVNALASETSGGGTPSTSNNNFWNGTIPWIQSSDLKEHHVFGIIERKHISKSAILYSAAKIVPKNSLAIVTRVGVGKVAIMPFSYATSQDFLSLSKLKTDLNFTAYLLYKKLQNMLHSVQGTAIKGITKDELLKKVVLIPEMPEQQKIGNFFTNLDNLITLHQHKLKKLKNIKKACLEKMFV